MRDTDNKSKIKQAKFKKIWGRFKKVWEIFKNFEMDVKKGTKKFHENFNK